VEARIWRTVISCVDKFAEELRTTLRDQQCALVCPGRRAYAAVLFRPQNIPRIGKKSGEADRALSLIHLSIREKEFPGMWVCSAVGKNQFERQPSFFRFTAGLSREPPVEVEVLLLADREIHPDGIDS